MNLRFSNQEEAVISELIQLKIKIKIKFKFKFKFVGQVRNVMFPKKVERRGPEIYEFYTKAISLFDS